MVQIVAIIGLFSPTTAGGERGEKFSMGLTALLNDAIVLLMVTDLLPKDPDNFPMLGGLSMIGTNDQTTTARKIHNDLDWTNFVGDSGRHIEHSLAIVGTRWFQAAKVALSTALCWHQ
jgi:hypothetical protein